MLTAVRESTTPVMAISDLPLTVALPPVHTLAPLPPHAAEPVPDEKPPNPTQFDIWATIQEAKRDTPPDAGGAPYVHPLMKRSASFLSQKSLEVCTESLGSETGSDGFSDTFAGLSDDEYISDDDGAFVVEPVSGDKELAAVNYHCSINKRSPPRSFPPPLPSISRRDGPCIHVKPRRRNGRLVMHAVPVSSQNYLHCKRQEGRLLLSFIETAFEEIYPDVSTDEENVGTKQQEKMTAMEEEKEEAVEEEEEEDEEEEDEEEEEEDEEEEEVEVVDRGITVEVKVSRQPQTQSGGGGGGGVKVHKSSLVINKFVSGTAPVANLHREEKVMDTNNYINASVATEVEMEKKHGERWMMGMEEEMEEWGSGKKGKEEDYTCEKDQKLLFSSKRMMNRQDLLLQVRRCSGHNNHSPLFVWEPVCIAT